MLTRPIPPSPPITTIPLQSRLLRMERLWNRHQHGCMIAGAPIAVDVWNKHTRCNAELFFLSHFHKDHYAGLNKSWDKPIYGSALTLKLVKEMLKVRHSLLKVLEVNECSILAYDEGKQTVSVTAIDANHVPGALMFLFQGSFGSIFCTGDFRYEKSMFDGIPTLPEIDVLYLDNTYWFPTGQFPSREDAAGEMVEKIRQCYEHAERIVIFLDSLGKEELLRLVAETFQTRIHVHPVRRRIMAITGYGDLLASDASETKISVLPMSHLKSFARKNAKNGDVYSIIPTSRFLFCQTNPLKHLPNVLVVNYSLHSSYEEVNEFLRIIKPKKIVRLVDHEGTVTSVGDGKPSYNLSAHSTCGECSEKSKSMPSLTHKQKINSLVKPTARGLVKSRETWVRTANLRRLPCDLATPKRQKYNLRSLQSNFTSSRSVDASESSVEDEVKKDRHNKSDLRASARRRSLTNAGVQFCPSSPEARAEMSPPRPSRHYSFTRIRNPISGDIAMQQRQKLETDNNMTESQRRGLELMYRFCSAKWIQVQEFKCKKASD